MVDKYTLFLLKSEDVLIDITDRVGDLSWSDSLDGLGMELGFDMVRNPYDKYIDRLDILKIGDKVLLANNGFEVTRGIVTDVDWSMNKKSVKVFDYAFYLNQSKIVKQFRKVKASEAILKLCQTFGVSVGKIANIDTSISKIYKDKTIAEIIKDILKQATQELGVEYRMEMRYGQLFIEPYTDLLVTATYKMAENIAEFDVTKAIGGISKSESIKDMRNSVIVTTNNEEVEAILVEEKDDQNILKFGLLQEVMSVDEKEKSQAENIAKNELKKLNRVSESISLDLLGCDLVRSGRILVIQNSEFDMDGQYLVKSCSHTFKNGIHKMSIEVDKVVVE